MNQNPQTQHWRDLGAKDKAAIITACLSVALGFLLVFLGMFISPMGEIDGSVLTAFGTALLYAGGIFGVAMYFKNGNNELLTSILNAVEEKIEERLKRNDSID